MTEMYELSLTDRRETLTKLRPVYVARTRRISLHNSSADGLFYSEKNPAKYSKFVFFQDFFSAVVEILSYSGFSNALISLRRMTNSLYYYIVAGGPE